MKLKREGVKPQSHQEPPESGQRWLGDVFQRAPSFLAVTRGPDHILELANERYYELIQQQLNQLTVESDQRRRLYETVLSCTPDFVYVFSLDHRILYANNSLLTMWNRRWEDAIGKTLLEIGYEPWLAEMHGREIDEVRTSKHPVRGEVPFSGTHGRRVYEYIFAPVLNDEGVVEAVAGTTRDVTERRQMEDALRESDRNKDEFIALLAHELRNPLAPLRSGLEIMRLRQDDSSAISETRAMMERQLVHMVRLVDDLLDISRLSQNKMELRRSQVLLSDIVNSAVETSRPAIVAGRHELEVLLPPEPIHLDADLTRLAQVFSNLICNSAKYTQEGGRIMLAAEQQGSEIVISVADNGIGIPAESLPKVFDMFSQVDRSIERTNSGLGIGLALVKGLVEKHEGSVTAASDGVNKGSTFVVRLPVLGASKGGESKEAVSTGPSAAIGARRRVLVVDDNRDAATTMALMLKFMGSDVTVAHDGLEAVEVAEATQPDVILMDVGMPRLNGYEATSRIRERERNTDGARPAIIIALTGWGQDEDRALSKKAGCDRHLVKPVDLQELEKLLKELEGNQGG